MSFKMPMLQKSQLQVLCNQKQQMVKVDTAASQVFKIVLFCNLFAPLLSGEQAQRMKTLKNCGKEKHKTEKSLAVKCSHCHCFFKKEFLCICIHTTNETCSKPTVLTLRVPEIRCYSSPPKHSLPLPVRLEMFRSPRESLNIL